MNQPLDDVRVLLVEDDEDDYLITSDILQLCPRVRFHLEWQQTATAGMSAILAQRHDVYLIDFRLGHRDGLDLIGEARRAGCEGPFILLTGLDDWDIDVRAMEAGAADYLVKGKLDSKLIERSIRYAIGQQRAKAELMRYATEIDRKNQDLRQAIRASREATEFKNQFLANVSDEIRSPMSAVLGMNHLLLETKLDAEQREYAEATHQSAQALLRIIDDILDIARMEAHNLELNSSVFMPAGLIDEVLHLSSAWLRQKSLKQDLDIAQELRGTFWGDAVRIRQVLLNLVNNAIKFTERGAISLSATVDLEDESVTWVRFEVRDTGVGIPDVARGRIFQPFYQADGSFKRKFGGAGLGLAISKQLVELLGGRIGFETGLNGSQFWFTVPLKACGPEGLANPAILAEAVSRPQQPAWVLPLPGEP